MTQSIEDVRLIACKLDRREENYRSTHRDMQT